MPRQVHGTIAFRFTTLNDPADLTFNRLLGINNEARIGGYYGSGAPGHPNKGYVVDPPYQPRNYRNENFPVATETQVTSLNNRHYLAGFFVDARQKIFGFVQVKGLWWNYDDPHARAAKPVTELLGINDAGMAVGYYKNASGLNKGFELNVATGLFKTLTPPGGDNATASGINGSGDVVGFLRARSDNVVSFLLRNGAYKEFSFPGSRDTEAMGVTVQDEVVGSYVDRSGATHGFLLTDPLHKDATWQPIDDPNGKKMTVVSDINLHGVLVGYYVDGSGNTNGFVATPTSERR